MQSFSSIVSELQKVRTSDEWAALIAARPAPTPCEWEGIIGDAKALQIRVDGQWGAMTRNRGQVVFSPAMQQFTVLDGGPAHGASFTVPLPLLTCETLQAKFAELCESFASAVA